MSILCPATTTSQDPCANDVMVDFLRKVFGKDFINAFLTGNGHPALTPLATDTLMPTIATGIANASMFVVVFMLVFVTYKWIIDSANDGEAHGLSAEKGSLLGMLGRPLLSVVMLAVTPSGYPVIHIIIVAIVLNANGWANTLLTSYNSQSLNVSSTAKNADDPLLVSANDMTKPAVYGALHGYCVKLATAQFSTTMNATVSSKSENSKNIKKVIYEDKGLLGIFPLSGISGSMCGSFSNYAMEYKPITDVVGSDPAETTMTGLQNQMAVMGVKISNIRQRNAVKAYLSGFKAAYGSMADQYIQKFYPDLYAIANNPAVDAVNGITVENGIPQLGNQLYFEPTGGFIPTGWAIPDAQVGTQPTNGQPTNGQPTNGQPGTGQQQGSNNTVSVAQLADIANKAQTATVSQIRDVLNFSGVGTVQNGRYTQINAAVKSLIKASVEKGWADVGTNRSRINRFRATINTALLSKPYNVTLAVPKPTGEANDSVNVFVNSYSSMIQAVLSEFNTRNNNGFSDMELESSFTAARLQGEARPDVFDSAINWVTDSLLGMEAGVLSTLVGTDDNVDAVTRIQDAGESFFVAAASFSVLKAGIEATFVIASSATDSTIGKVVDTVTSGGVVGSIVGALYQYWVNSLSKDFQSVIDTLFLISRTFAVIIPTMPYIFLMMAAVGWLLQIIQTMIGMPLFFIMHAIPQNSFIGNQQQGYVTLVSLFFRPLIIISAFIIAFELYDPALTYYTKGFIAMHSQLVGGSTDSATVRLVATVMTFKYFWYVYAGGLMGLTYLIFGLIQELGDSVLNWLGVNLFGGFGNLDTGGIMKGASGGMNMAAQNRRQRLNHQQDKEDAAKAQQQQQPGNGGNPPNPNGGGDGGVGGGGNGTGGSDGYAPVQGANNANSGISGTSSAPLSGNDISGNQVGTITGNTQPDNGGNFNYQTSLGNGVSLGAASILGAAYMGNGAIRGAINGLKQANKAGNAGLGSALKGAMRGAGLGVSMGLNTYGNKNNFAANRQFFKQNAGLSRKQIGAIHAYNNTPTTTFGTGSGSVLPGSFQMLTNGGQSYTASYGLPPSLKGANPQQASALFNKSMFAPSKVAHDMVSSPASNQGGSSAMFTAASPTANPFTSGVLTAKGMGVGLPPPARAVVAGATTMASSPASNKGGSTAMFTAASPTANPFTSGVLTPKGMGVGLIPKATTPVTKTTPTAIGSLSKSKLTPVSTATSAFRSPVLTAKGMGDLTTPPDISEPKDKGVTSTNAPLPKFDDKFGGQQQPSLTVNGKDSNNLFDPTTSKNPVLSNVNTTVRVKNDDLGDTSKKLDATDLTSLGVSGLSRPEETSDYRTMPIKNADMDSNVMATTASEFRGTEAYGAQAITIEMNANRPASSTNIVADSFASDINQPTTTLASDLSNDTARQDVSASATTAPIVEPNPVAQPTVSDVVSATSVDDLGSNTARQDVSASATTAPIVEPTSIPQTVDPMPTIVQTNERPVGTATIVDSSSQGESMVAPSFVADSSDFAVKPASTSTFVDTSTTQPTAQRAIAPSASASQAQQIVETEATSKPKSEEQQSVSATTAQPTPVVANQVATPTVSKDFSPVSSNSLATTFVYSAAEMQRRKMELTSAASQARIQDDESAAEAKRKEQKKKQSQAVTTTTVSADSSPSDNTTPVIKPPSIAEMNTANQSAAKSRPVSVESDLTSNNPFTAIQDPIVVEQPISTPVSTNETRPIADTNNTAASKPASTQTVISNDDKPVVRIKSDSDTSPTPQRTTENVDTQDLTPFNASKQNQPASKMAELPQDNPTKINVGANKDGNIANNKTIPNDDE